MKKFSVKILAVLGIMLMGSQSVFASATSNSEAMTKVDGVIVVTAQSQMLYVEAGRFFREYRTQLLADLTNVEKLVEQSQESLDLIKVELPQYAASFQIAAIAD